MDLYSTLALVLNFFELFACVAGFLNWHKIKDSYWKWFPFYLGIIFLTEMTCEYIHHFLGRKDINAHIYFFFGIPIQFVFFFWLFSRWNSNNIQKKWAIGSAVIYILAWIAEFLFLKGNQLSFLSFSYTIGNILLLILILRFFINFVTSDRILGYRSEPMFWVCLGLLVFYLGSLPFFALWNTIATNFDFFNNYWIVQMVLNYTMYLFFAISFILGKWKQQS